MGIIAKAWSSYAERVLHPRCSSTQRQETRRAFYAGAQGLLGGLMGLFDPDREPTAADYKVMEEVGQELTDFQRAVAEGRA